MEISTNELRATLNLSLNTTVSTTICRSEKRVDGTIPVPKVKKTSKSTEEEFFKGKRPWSKIKDQILQQYMPPYLSKVAKLQKPIILIDAFAGPGKFEDESAGSPLIICSAARKHLKDNYLAIFVNKKIKHHKRLSHVLSDFDNAVLIQGSADEFLAKVRSVLTDHTVFLYLDPFGLKGCEFSVIEPFLRRDQEYSTEIVINLNISTVHRLAARKAVEENRANTPEIRAFHKQLTKTLGGDYWREILLSDNSKKPEEKAEDLMAKYCGKILDIGSPGAFSAYCPVREKEGGVIKYYLAFYSRSEHAMLLMNDIMCKAYNQHMHERWKTGTLFENFTWEKFCGTQNLENIILKFVLETQYKSRQDIWFNIVQRNFMRFTKSQYRKTVKKLVEEEKISFKDVRGTGKINDEAQLYIPIPKEKNQ